MNGTDLSGTVAILAQGTNWADAVTQAFLSDTVEVTGGRAGGSYGRPGRGELRAAGPGELRTARPGELRAARPGQTDGKKIIYTSRFVRVILAQGPC